MIVYFYNSRSVNFFTVYTVCHEHQNPRGQPIQWNEPVVYKWAADTQGWDKATTKHNILEHYDLSQINGSDFDPLSVMLYFFPAELTLNGAGTKQNLRLSGEDVLWINKNYAAGSPQTAEQFYQNVYGISLDKALALSGSVNQKIKNGEDPNNIDVSDPKDNAMLVFIKKYGIVIFLALIIIFFIVLILKRLMTKSNQNRQMFLNRYNF